MKENARRREAEEKQRKARIAKEKAEREKQERQMKKRRLLEVNTGEMFISHSLKVFTRVSFREITFEDGWKKPLHTFLGARFKPAEVCCCQSVTIADIIPQTRSKIQFCDWWFWGCCFVVTEFWIRPICICMLPIIFTLAFIHNYLSNHQHHNDVTQCMMILEMWLDF